MRRILLDCDPGHDDAIALLLAAGSPVIDLVAVTTVAGNQTIEKVTRNALAVATIAGLNDLTIAPGAHRPLVRDPIVAPEYHGESGLDGPILPLPTLAADARHGVQVIIDTVMDAEPGSITIVATGTMTNLALAARLEPDIIGLVHEVVIMGGAGSGGNLTPAAEFNIASDPEAAAVVFSAGWNVTMAGLDITHQAVADQGVLDELATIDTDAARFVLELLEFFTATYREQGFDWPPVHDAVAVALVADPSIATIRRAPIAVETSGALTSGQTVVDLRHVASADCPTAIALDLDRTRFWRMVADALRALP